MKIENLEILSFSDRKYSEDTFKYDSDRSYVGYLDKDAAISKFKNAAAFCVDKLRIENGKLFGDLNIINAPASELLVWINSFELSPLLNCGVDEISGEIVEVELDSFIASPIQ